MELLVSRLDVELEFPISRDPPEGGTALPRRRAGRLAGGFQFLGIPQKGERPPEFRHTYTVFQFPISRDPPEGGT